MSANASATNKEYEALKQDIDTLRADLRTMTARIAELGAAAVDDARSGGKAGIETLRAELEDALDELKTVGRSQLDKAERQVQEQPLIAVLAAFGIGFLVAKLTGR